jgi:DnaK suppressor protein
MSLSRAQSKELERQIRSRLAALEAEIHADVARAQDDSYAALAGPVTDPADEAAAHLLADVEKAEISRDLGEARELEAALGRIADGSYGICSHCGGEIALKRLRIYPGATRCIECQRVHEKTYAHPGEPRL